MVLYKIMVHSFILPFSFFQKWFIDCIHVVHTIVIKSFNNWWHSWYFFYESVGFIWWQHLILIRGYHSYNEATGIVICMSHDDTCFLNNNLSTQIKTIIERCQHMHEKNKGKQSFFAFIFCRFSTISNDKKARYNMDYLWTSSQLNRLWVCFVLNSKRVEFVIKLLGLWINIISFVDILLGHSFFHHTAGIKSATIMPVLTTKNEIFHYLHFFHYSQT